MQKSKYTLDKLPDTHSLSVGEDQVLCASTVKNNGATTDETLSMTPHIHNTTQEATTTLVHAFITSKLDNR